MPRKWEIVLLLCTLSSDSQRAWEKEMQTGNQQSWVPNDAPATKSQCDPGPGSPRASTVCLERKQFEWIIFWTYLWEILLYFLRSSVRCLHCSVLFVCHSVKTELFVCSAPGCFPALSPSSSSWMSNIISSCESYQKEESSVTLYFREGPQTGLQGSY